MDGRFRDRQVAGYALAQSLEAYTRHPKAVVVGLPRGGVPVAFEVAKALSLPLDICLVRKIGHPRNRELALGAIASPGLRVLNSGIIERSKVPPQVVDQISLQEQEILRQRQRLYRQFCPGRPWKDATVILVDDGIATGATAQVAVSAVRQQNPAWIVVATPIASPNLGQILHEVDELVCLQTPDPLDAIGCWYKTFPQVPDQVVCHLLQQAHQFSSATPV